MNRKEKETKFERILWFNTEKFYIIFADISGGNYEQISGYVRDRRQSSIGKQYERCKIKNFILVVKNAEDITWLAGPLAELRARLLKVRKIWGVEVVVLNEELAGEYNLTC